MKYDWYITYHIFSQIQDLENGGNSASFIVQTIIDVTIFYG